MIELFQVRAIIPEQRVLGKRANAPGNGNVFTKTPCSRPIWLRDKPSMTARQAAFEHPVTMAVLSEQRGTLIKIYPVHKRER